MFNLLYISYLPGSGGKFLANCLYLCDNVIFNEPLTDKQLILNRILNSIPPMEDRENWVDYEVYNIYPFPDSQLSKQQQQYLNDQIGYLPTIANDLQTLEQYIQTLGNGIKLQILPDKEFVDLAIALKWNALDNGQFPSMCLDSYQNWKDELSVIDFDIQVKDFNPLDDKVFSDLEHIFDHLNIKHAHWNYIDCYIKKYRSWHDQGKQMLANLR